MEIDNQQLSITEFEKIISWLPCKQQLAVRASFEAAKRKSTKGIMYADEWLLECILMRMRSPRLYEQIRRHNILALPGRTCLQKRINNLKSGFGFNPNVFSAFSEKTKHMNDFSRRGGIVFDEIKLSEHLDVKSCGKTRFTYLLNYWYYIYLPHMQPLIHIFQVNWRASLIWHNSQLRLRSSSCQATAWWFCFSLSRERYHVRCLFCACICNGIWLYWIEIMFCGLHLGKWTEILGDCIAKQDQSRYLG